VGEVVDNGGDSTWKPGDKVAAVMGEMGRAFDGISDNAIGYTLTLWVRRLCRICEYAEEKRKQTSNVPLRLRMGRIWGDPGEFCHMYVLLKVADS